MQKITLLDCTLRDGGYINEWRFGEKNIRKIVQKLVQSGVDIIECGYLSTKKVGSSDIARFSSIQDVRRACASTKGSYQSYAVMVNLGEFPVELLSDAEEDSPIIRVAFHKKDLNAAFVYFRELKKLGFRFYVQPMGALNYTDEEFLHLIKITNELMPEAFYVVDSFGVMELKDFRRLLFLIDNNLNADIVVGYHSHNNLQQAYSNSKYMVEQNLSHDVIIDASVFGMGRGAGNLNIELFAKYLNENHDKNYNIEPILEVFDECLKPIFAKNFWGYSLPFYLSSIHNCHPNYASFLAEKNTLSVRSMHELLSTISEEDKGLFTDEKANEYYLKYQENYIDDQEALDMLKKKIEGREILILAPGKSLKDKKAEILKFVEEHKPVVFGISRVSDDYMYDYLFVANEKRFPNDNLKNVGKLIITSNLRKTEDDVIKVNYSSYLCLNENKCDDPTLMVINMLMAIGVRNISLAGFDGFSANPDENYFNEGMSLGSMITSKMLKNDVIAIHLAKLKEQVELNFITPSRYVE